MVAAVMLYSAVLTATMICSIGDTLMFYHYGVDDDGNGSRRSAEDRETWVLEALDKPHFEQALDMWCAPLCFIPFSVSSKLFARTHLLPPPPLVSFFCLIYPLFACFMENLAVFEDSAPPPAARVAFLTCFRGPCDEKRSP